jgi:uncharacterized membrane protein YraQ (UPF0718 family)
MLHEMITYVGNTLIHNAPFLAFGIVTAAWIKVFINPEQVRFWLLKRTSVSIPSSVLFGALTPFCACGTMAVVISLFATALPWGPIMAFLTSSPLMSPSLFVFYSGIMGARFAVMMATASISIGMVGGITAHYLEKNTSWLEGQIRFAAPTSKPSCECSNMTANQPYPVASECCSSKTDTIPQTISIPTPTGQLACCTAGVSPSSHSLAIISANTSSYSLRFDFAKIRQFLKEVFEIGVKKILVYFSLFAAIGYLVNQFVPGDLIMALFSSTHWYAVPLAALVGLPMYVTGASALPLMQVMIDAGASWGSVIAFLITGPGTSVGVLAGLSLILKPKALGLYIAIILIGSIIAGYLTDLMFIG